MLVAKKFIFDGDGGESRVLDIRDLLFYRSIEACDSGTFNFHSEDGHLSS